MPAYVGLCGTESHQCAARRQPVRCSVIAVLCCTYVFQPHHLANVGLHYAPDSVHGSILQSRFVFDGIAMVPPDMAVVQGQTAL
jgi:hypothetical protein